MGLFRSYAKFKIWKRMFYAVRDLFRSRRSSAARRRTRRGVRV